MRALSYDELRSLYRKFLHNQSISKATINTAYVDTFYLWRKESNTQLKSKIAEVQSLCTIDLS